MEEEEGNKGFDPETTNGKNILSFLKIVKDEEILYNLLVTVNSVNS